MIVLVILVFVLRVGKSLPRRRRFAFSSQKLLLNLCSGGSVGLRFQTPVCHATAVLRVFGPWGVNRLCCHVATKARNRHGD